METRKNKLALIYFFIGAKLYLSVLATFISIKIFREKNSYGLIEIAPVANWYLSNHAAVNPHLNRTTSSIFW